MAENDFSEDNKAKNTLNEESFLHYFENIFGHGKHQKGHGKSCNFIKLKEYTVQTLIEYVLL